jgi:hypothetical protein
MRPQGQAVAVGPSPSRRRSKPLPAGGHAPQGQAVAVGPSPSRRRSKPPPAGGHAPQGQAVAVGPRLSRRRSKPHPAGAMRPQGQAVAVGPRLSRRRSKPSPAGAMRPRAKRWRWGQGSAAGDRSPHRQGPCSPGPSGGGPWDFALPFIASSARGGGRRPAAIGRGHVSACQRPSAPYYRQAIDRAGKMTR